MKYICPTLGEDHEKDFLVCGTPDEFKIIVFSSHEEFEKGFEYLELADYEPTEVSVELFKELSENDDDFKGLVVNPHSENRFISKREVLEL